MPAGHPPVRCCASAVGLAAPLLALTLCANAAALGAKPLQVATPMQSGPPAVAVDATGTAYIAWANTSAVSANTLQYCVLPAGASACSQSGTLMPADSAQAIDGVQVLVDANTVVLLADVYGTAGPNDGDYEPEQEWASTDGGATFTLVDGGLSVADGILSADTQPLSAVVLPGTGALGYGWDSAAGNLTSGAVPTFAAFPLAGPPECSIAMCPTSYSLLQASTSTDQVGNAPGQFASELGASPGVLGIFFTDFESGPLGCPGSGTAHFGTAFVFGSGAQSATDSYSISPGGAGSAWKGPVAEADCDVEYAAVGGGAGGFGIVEDALGSAASSATIYHRFDAAHDDFDTAKVTIAKEGELDASLSQDAVGGIYATYLGGGDGGPVALSYSKDGGATWFGPATLDGDADGTVSDLTSAVGAAGQGYAVWNDKGSVYAQAFDAGEATAVDEVILGFSGTSTATTVTVNVTCLSLPRTVDVSLTVPASLLGSRRAAAGGAASASATIAGGRFTIRRSGQQLLALKLNKSGEAVIAAHHGSVKGTLTATVDVEGDSHSTSVPIEIRPKAAPAARATR